MYPTRLDEDYIVRNLTEKKDRIRFGSEAMTYRQMSLFDTEICGDDPAPDDRLQVVTGQL